jgi:hypothetical protein
MKRAMLPLTVLAVVIVIIGAVFWLRSGPDASQFADLRDPRFIRLPDERMLVVEATGDPNLVGARAFKQLFSTYYALDGVSRRQRPPAPRARWPRPARLERGRTATRRKCFMPVLTARKNPTSTGCTRS